jgi:pentafunctional AROM polypeptide
LNIVEGLRAGADWIDVEAGWDNHSTFAFLDVAEKYKHTRILGSFHETTGLSSHANTLRLMEQCTLNGRAHAVKLVTRALSYMDAVYLHCAAAVSSVPATMPYCCVCLGDEGRVSRVLNKRFTPVTHPSLPTKAAPGQMSVRELMHARVAAGVMLPRKYYLFGQPIGASPSATMHNAALQHFFLPHTYEKYESGDVSIYRELMKEGTFGGASVTIPHKEVSTYAYVQASDCGRVYL